MQCTYNVQYIFIVYKMYTHTIRVELWGFSRPRDTETK